jgi:hypothetical protein
MILINPFRREKRYSVLLLFALVLMAAGCKKDKINILPAIAELKKPDKVDKIAGTYEGNVEYTYSRMTSYPYPGNPVYTSLIRTYDAQVKIEKISPDSFKIRCDNFYDSSISWSYRLGYDTSSYTINKTVGHSNDITTITFSGDSVAITEGKSQRLSAGNVYDDIHRRVFRGKKK